MPVLAPQELSRLLSEPLQPAFSKRYFAGRPSVHGASAAGGGAAAPDPLDTAQAGGEERGAAGMHTAVALARSLADSRKQATAKVYTPLAAFVWRGGVQVGVRHWLAALCSVRLMRGAVWCERGLPPWLGV